MLEMKKKMKFVFIASAFAVLILIVLINVFNMTRVTEKDFQTYRQGLEYLNKNDFENAYFNFSNVSKNSAIYEIALLRQAICADELNDYDTAIKKYRLFIEKYPESVFVKKAYYSLAQNYFRAKDYNRAEKTFNDIRRFFKDCDYKTAANYYLGIICEQKAQEKIKEEKEKFKNEQPEIVEEKIKNNKEINELKQKSKIYFANYLQDVPNGRFSLNSADEIQKLGVKLTQRDFYLIGRTYFKNSRYKQAYDNFNKSYMSSCWGYLAEIYRKQGNYKKYREIFEHNYPVYSKNIDEKDLRTFLENYAYAYPYGTKAGWYKLLEIGKNATAQDYILYRLAKIETPEQKINIYNRIYKEFPQGNYASDALSSLFWNAYADKNFDKAYTLGLLHIKNYPNTIAAPKILFWTGKIAEMQGNYTEAKGFYQRVLDEYPDNYYAYRASKHLNQRYNRNWKTKSSHRLPEKDRVVKPPLSHSGISQDSISVIESVLKLNDYKLIGEIDKDNKAIQSWLSYQEGDISTAALLARDAIEELPKRPAFSDSLYLLAYPLKYQEVINDTARQYRLDPYLVSALIREESYFNPKAGSSAGAMGLMQLMPATASYIAQRNGIPYRGCSSLYVPEKNIELGCAYLDYVKEKHYENDLLAVASYNGGPNAVSSWKSNLDYKSFDEFIENIPYAETRDYIKKVYRSYWVYLNIY